MKLVHMADLHLGFRQFQKLAPDGGNQRERDVETAFARVVDKTIEIRPNVVAIAGDVFHAVRPPNQAIRFAYRQLARLRSELPQADVVMIAGNHDTPRTTDTGHLLPLFAEIGIHVIVETTRLTLQDGQLGMLCVPDHMRPKPEYTPDPAACFNVLLIHDQVQDGTRRYGPARPADEVVSPGELSGFDYVALGDYHVYQQVAPNAYYSGSIEYTSSNIWREVDEHAKNAEGERGKGIIERDLSTGEHRFHVIPSAREVVDLPVISGSAITSAELTEAVCAAADAWPGGIEDKIVRLVVTDVPKYIVRDLDHRRIRKLKARALSFMLDTRVPEEVHFSNIGSGRAALQRLPLKELVREMLGSREVSPGIDRDALTALAMHYLDEVEKAAPEVSQPSEAAA